MLKLGPPARGCAGPTAFMLGNEGQGLSPRQMALCDSFVYIPQYGAGTASLNVAVACSIVLHHFALWAGARQGLCKCCDTYHFKQLRAGNAASVPCNEQAATLVQKHLNLS